MAGSATNSAIEVAYWFISRAEDEGLFLEDEKLHHLLFLAQVHFALANNMELLMPSLFVCGENGFSEPNLAVMFAQGALHAAEKTFRQGQQFSGQGMETVCTAFGQRAESDDKIQPCIPELLYQRRKKHCPAQDHC